MGGSSSRGHCLAASGIRVNSVPLEPEELELWRRYRESKDMAARDFIFFRYTSWARSVAAQVYRRLRVVQIEWADYVQNAQIGLLEAMSRFNETRGTDFIAYAKPRVRGSVFNGVRAILREEGQRRSLLGERVERLQSIGNESSSDPLNDFISAVVGLGLGHMLETEQFGQVPRDALALVEHHELGVALRDSLLELGERDRDIILAHYFKHVPFQEIAKLRGVTKGRISQIHKGALVRLREILAERRNDYLSL